MRASPNLRLSAASSLYLRQHAMNPVDWWPWGDEAFDEARRRGLPVFVSIGYSACHWCHVMERESFEDEDIAAFLNERFVCVKVDREERPDVDAVYMDALAVIGVPGGWPASLWLTHERAPFYAGTYFAPVPAFGRPGFKQILEAVDRVWREDPARVVEASGNVRAKLIARAEVTRRHEDLPLELIVAAARALEEGWDDAHGGWGRGHKFPMPARVELLLATGSRLNDTAALALARAALTAICEGGLQDQLGGGFHRYCVDPAWTVPHFEKMLFDNAQLLGLLARGAVAFGDARLAQDARATARFLLDELAVSGGGLGASFDADSGGVEGSYYTWTPAEVQSLLQPSLAAAFCVAYGVTEGGNFEGASVLTRRGRDVSGLDEARVTLTAARAKRTSPGRDEQVVMAWNGLAVGALADAGRLLDAPELTQAASELGARLLSRFADGRLPRTLALDSPPGVLEDYAFLAEGLLAVFSATGAPWAVTGAEALVTTLLHRFSLPDGGLARSEATAPGLDLRPVALQEGAEPSGYGRAAVVMARLLALGSPAVDEARLERLLVAAGAWARRSPGAAPSLVLALLHRRAPGRELVIVTPSVDHPSLPPLLAVARAHLTPLDVLAVVTPETAPGLAHLSAIRRKTAAPGGARAYLCERGACGLPVTTADRLLHQLTPQATTGASTP